MYPGKLQCRIEKRSFVYNSMCHQGIFEICDLLKRMATSVKNLIISSIKPQPILHHL